MAEYFLMFDNSHLQANLSYDCYLQNERFSTQKSLKPWQKKMTLILLNVTQS